MRRDALYLTDIVEAADDIAEFIRGRSEDDFAQDKLARSAVLQKLIVIGEAASRMSKATVTAHPEIPWRDVIAFRNIAVHAYFSVDWAIVWNTARVDVPWLRTRVAQALKLADESH